MIGASFILIILVQIFFVCGGHLARKIIIETFMLHTNINSVNSSSVESNINQLTSIRHDWKVSEIQALYDLPMNDLLFKAQTVHRETFDPNQVQTSTLMSIKTGACPEDCAYCPQSGHYNTGLSKEQLVALDEVIKNAKNGQIS